MVFRSRYETRRVEAASEASRCLCQERKSAFYHRDPQMYSE